VSWIQLLVGNEKWVLKCVAECDAPYGNRCWKWRKNMTET